MTRKQRIFFYWITVFIACIVAVLAMWNIMNFTEGVFGTFAIFLGAVAVYGLVEGDWSDKK